MSALSQKESDIQLMLAASCHLGTRNCDYQMERYVYKRRLDGIYVINLGKTWEKLHLAARVIVGIENPQVGTLQLRLVEGRVLAVGQWPRQVLPSMAIQDQHASYAATWAGSVAVLHSAHVLLDRDHPFSAFAFRAHDSSSPGVGCRTL